MLNVSVIVVCLNEQANIGQCLSSLIRQNYPTNKYEIICVDNGSDDDTQKIIQGYCRQRDNIKMIINPIRGIAGSRNVGIMNAQYKMVAFIDADCSAPENWISELVRGYEYYSVRISNLAAVGGANLSPPSLSRFYNVLAIFLNSFFGSHGSVQGMHYKNDRIVPHLPTVNVMYSKQALITVGAFDISFACIGEDQDLSYRLLDHDYILHYLAVPAVQHNLRPNYPSWFHNMFIYGKGRMWLMRKYPKKIKPVLLLPLLLVLSMSGLFMSWYSLFFLLPLLYFILILIISFYNCIMTQKPEYVMNLYYLYVGSHFAYGLGQWYGLIRNRDFYRLKAQKQLIIAAENENTAN
jgi:glycosyltransferase involved in cell wall biosynthesis